MPKAMIATASDNTTNIITMGGLPGLGGANIESPAMNMIAANSARLPEMNTNHRWFNAHSKIKRYRCSSPAKRCSNQTAKRPDGCSTSSPRRYHRDASIGVRVNETKSENNVAQTKPKASG